MVYCEADSLVFKFFVSKSVMSFNGPSFASARQCTTTLCVSSCGAGNSRNEGYRSHNIFIILFFT